MADRLVGDPAHYQVVSDPAQLAQAQAQMQMAQQAQAQAQNVSSSVYQCNSGPWALLTMRM